MALANTDTDFGAVTKCFHWLTALLIFTAFPLGLVADNWPMETEAQLSFKVTLFSFHKTLGVMLFLVALARIVWALSQRKPAPLHADRRAEAALAEVVHWVLYVALVLVPLSGWVHHASTTGFAPIWWPFGQRLPFVPMNEHLAETASMLHWVFNKVLLVAVGLHVLGALKHHLLDRDDTLRRMLPGRTVSAPVHARHHGIAPALTALAIYALAAAAGIALARPEAREGTAVQTLTETGWQVQEGTLSITVQQMGSEVIGQFEQWAAAITFDEVPVDGSHGRVEVEIAIDSLSLGSVTGQAMGADFFDAEAHPSAVFAADILPAGDDYVADGTLTIKGVTLPVVLPFTLQIEDDIARMEGQLSLDRREFGIGASQQNESTLGFGVSVNVALTAARTEESAP